MLSPAMMSALVDMLEMNFCVDYNSRTMRALESRGYTRWYPYSQPEPWVKSGCWKLTKDGKRIASALSQG